MTGDKAMNDIQLAETLHRQSQEAWEKRSAQLKSSNKQYLLKISDLLHKKTNWQLALNTVSAELKDKRDTTLVSVIQLRRENILIRAKNHLLEEEVAKAFNHTKEALNEVVDTSKTWEVKAFEMLAMPEEFSRFKRRLEFQDSLHRAMVIAEEPHVFLDSSDDEAEAENNEESLVDGQDTPPAL